MRVADMCPKTLRACSREIATEAAHWRRIANQTERAEIERLRFAVIATRLETYAGIFGRRASDNEKRSRKKALAAKKTKARGT